MMSRTNERTNEHGNIARGINSRFPFASQSVSHSHSTLDSPAACIFHLIHSGLKSRRRSFRHRSFSSHSNKPVTNL